MSKTTILFRGPVETRSGYGGHARDLLFALREMDLFDISVDSCPWGHTPMTALENGNEFHDWIKTKKVSKFEGLPDIYIQVTVPNEFRRFGKYNIGITAGIETTVAPIEWVHGCNQMDLVITTSNFSRDVLVQTVYNENDKINGRLVKQHRIEKPIKVLFEGIDRNVYYKTQSEFDLSIDEDFAFLFVGHWLKGDLGQDRKDVGMLIKCFAEAFANLENQPALVLKTSSANFSVKERENFRDRIENLTKDFRNPPPIYLLFGDLKDEEMNSLYNHTKIKSMVSITKGEGFGRPLLEFSMSGKPIIASNWSGHKDFLPTDRAVMLGGTITDVHPSATDNFIIKDSKWFTVNYGEVVEAMKLVMKNYDSVCKKSEELRIENEIKFSIDQMTNLFKSYLEPYLNLEEKPQMTKLNLPKLNKIK